MFASIVAAALSFSGLTAADSRDAGFDCRKLMPGADIEVEARLLHYLETSDGRKKTVRAGL